MNNQVYLLTYTSKEDYDRTGILRIPLETLITYCVHIYCQSEEVKLYFVYVGHNLDKASLTIKAKCIDFVQYKEIPWQVLSCEYPSAFYDNTIITGLCAVSRHIVKYRLSHRSLKESEEGLLSFRKCCLQAPNEVSIWTKFCEVDLLKTAKDLLHVEHIKEIPKTLVRFENHLNKPVRIHNVYKVTRNIYNDKETQVTKNMTHNIDLIDDTVKDSKRLAKNRKWKSNTKKDLLKDGTKSEDLKIYHQFAEGPFITLADLILFPSYYLMMQSFNEKLIETLLPLTYKWFFNIKAINEISNLNNILHTINIKRCEIEQTQLPVIEDVSLYKSDPKRHNPRKRLFTKPEDIENALRTIEDGMELGLSNSESDRCLDWSIVPDGANPAAGHLPDERIMRKSQQLENLCIAVLSMAKEGDYIVDFCSGSGHLGILIAHFLPTCKIILLENKENSLTRAKERVQEMGLKNVSFFQCNLDFFIGKFDIGIALHACGIASDLVLDKCLKANAKFVICPCCYGSLHATDRLSYPRSVMFQRMTIDQYLCIGHTADQTHNDHPLAIRGARCMAVIDSDRARLAEEFGYKVTLSRLKPLSCTPKNNLLIGLPS